jgi:hypothetical protein
MEIIHGGYWKIAPRAAINGHALNGGKTNFPEFHNLYIEPGSYELDKKTGDFPEGTIFFKGTAAVKDSKHYAETGGRVTKTSIITSRRRDS